MGGPSAGRVGAETQRKPIISVVDDIERKVNVLFEQQARLDHILGRILHPIPRDVAKAAQGGTPVQETLEGRLHQTLNLLDVFLVENEDLLSRLDNAV